MPIYSSLDRLNAMHDLFTVQGNKELDTGEVDALASFYGGSTAPSRAEIQDRLVEIFEQSTFAPGQQNRFRYLLLAAGMAPRLLETDDPAPATVSEFLALSEAEQHEILRETAQGQTRAIQTQDIARPARAKIMAEVKSWCASKQNALFDYDEYDPETDYVGEPTYAAVELDGKKGEVIGYVVDIPVYQADHDVGSRLLFDLKGDFIEQEYIGE